MKNYLSYSDIQFKKKTAFCHFALSVKYISIRLQAFSVQPNYNQFTPNYSDFRCWYLSPKVTQGVVKFGAKITVGPGYRQS